MKNIKHIRGLLFILIATFSGCIDNNETPPPFVPFEYGSVVTVQHIKDLYSAELAKDYTLRVPVKITDDCAIKGIITASDKKDGNLYKEAYIQDATGGLRLTFNSTSGLYIGDSVVVKLTAMYISDYGDFIQIGSTPYTDDSGDTRLKGMDMDETTLKLSINNPTVPDIITIPRVKSKTWLGKLVTINNVQFADDAVGLTYADYAADPPASANRYLMDCSKNKIIVRSSGYASFASDTITDLNGSITGIVTIFSSDYQLVIRDFSEVQLTNERCTPGIPDLGSPAETISQNFSGISNNADILITGWQNIPQYGDRTWLGKYYSGNTYAQATAFNSNLSNMASWLITNPVTISAQKILSFQSAIAYWKHTGTHVPLQVFYSTNYTGKNLVTATWVPINALLAGKTNSNYEFVNSGSISLPVESGKSCVIAFKYTGSDTESTNSCIDNIVISAAK
jgi:hypothetical protein